MALGTIVGGNTVIPHGTVTTPASVQADWVTLHDSLAAAAASATVLKTLLTNSSANVHYARVPAGASRVLLRARYVIAVTALSTQPKVQLYSIFDSGGSLMTGGDSAPAFANDGTVRWLRIDAATIAASATTITCAPSTDSLDATYGYGDPYDLTGFDLKGGAYVGALVQTAAVISGGAGAIALQALFLN